MKRTHLAILIVGVSVMLAAEPVCTRLVWHVPVHHEAAKKLDHKPTAKTIAGWRAWDLAKSLREYDLACSPVDLASLDSAPDFIPAEPLPAWEPVEIEPDVAVPAPEVPEASNPTLGYVLTPAAVSYAAAVPTPEPWPLGLVLPGAALLYLRKQ